MPESVEGLTESWVMYRFKAEIGRKYAKDIVARKPLRIIRTLDPSALELAHAMVSGTGAAAGLRKTNEVPAVRGQHLAKQDRILHQHPDQSRRLWNLHSRRLQIDPALERPEHRTGYVTADREPRPHSQPGRYRFHSQHLQNHPDHPHGRTPGR